MKLALAVLAVVMATLAFVPILPVAVGVGEGWTAPFRIAQGGEGTYSDVGLAVESGGRALVAWAHKVGNGTDPLYDPLYSAFVSRYKPGQGWGTPLEGPWGGGGFVVRGPGPSVAVDANGRGLLLTSECANSTGTLQAILLDPQEGMVETNDLTPQVLCSFRPAAVAMNNAGHGVAYWLQVRGLAGVWASWYDPAQGWEPAVHLWRFFPVSPLAVGVDPSGNAMVLWTDFGLAANRYEIGKGWSEGIRLIDYSLPENVSFGGIMGAGVGFDSSGKALVVWSDRLLVWQESGGIDHHEFIRAKAFDPVTGWKNSSVLASDIERGVYDYVDVAVNPAGQAMAVWRFNYSEVWASRFVPGSAWGEPVLLGTVEGRNVIPLDVAIGPEGSVLVAWSELNDTHAGVRVARFGPQSGWQQPFILASWEGGFGVPQVAMDAQGNGILAWAQRDGAGHGVWVSHLLVGDDGDTTLLLLAGGAGGATVAVAVGLMVWWRLRKR